MKEGDVMNNDFMRPMVICQKFSADAFIRNFRGFVDVGPMMSNFNCLIDSMGRIAYKEDNLKTILMMEVKNKFPEYSMEDIRKMDQKEMMDISDSILINLGRVSLPSRGVNLLQRHTLEQLKLGGLIEDKLTGIVYVNQH